MKLKQLYSLFFQKICLAMTQKVAVCIVYKIKTILGHSFFLSDKYLKTWGSSWSVTFSMFVTASCQAQLDVELNH